MEHVIYVFPTIEGTPPRAGIFHGDPRDGDICVLAMWSNDTGGWMNEQGIPLPEDLGEAITEHAKSLGVEW